MFSTTIYKILCVWVPIRWKWVIIFQSLIPSGSCDFLNFRRTPPPLIWTFPNWNLRIFCFFEPEIQTFLFFDTTPAPPLIWNISQFSLRFWLESFSKRPSQSHCGCISGVVLSSMVNCDLGSTPDLSDLLNNLLSLKSNCAFQVSWDQRYINLKLRESRYHR